MGASRKTCPSAPCQEGATLLAIRIDEEHLAYVSPAIQVTREFVEREGGRGRPEARFRFSSTCQEGACPQWTGTRCGVADLAVNEAARVGMALPTSLPACSIRRTCRWYSQDGRKACTICPLIVSDTGGTATYSSVGEKGRVVFLRNAPKDASSIT